MSWYKISKTLTYRDYRNLVSSILDVATQYFSEIMKRGAGDPLPSSEAVVKNPISLGYRIGLTEVNSIALIRKIMEEYKFDYTNNSIKITWQELPQQYKQRARIYSKTLKVTE